MKQKLVTLLLILFLLVAVAFTTYAGGDKVRGGCGAGSANQSHVQDPPPFQD